MKKGRVGEAILEDRNRIKKFTKHGTEERTPPELTTVNSKL